MQIETCKIKVLFLGNYLNWLLFFFFRITLGGGVSDFFSISSSSIDLENDFLEHSAFIFNTIFWICVSRPMYGLCPFLSSFSIA